VKSRLGGRSSNKSWIAVSWRRSGCLAARSSLSPALSCSLLGIAAILALMMRTWLALLIFGIVVVGVGAVLAKPGIAMLSLETLAPDRAAANLQKDAQLLKEHT
jgi:hypothetical protein